MKPMIEAQKLSDFARYSSRPLPDRAVKVLATSIFRHLQNEGCQPKDIISVSTQLLSLVTTQLKKNNPITP